MRYSPADGATDTARGWFAVALLIALVAGISGCGRLLRGAPDPRDFHDRALVADLHSDSALRMVKGFDFSARDSTGHMDIPRLQAGGVDLQAFACWLSTSTPAEECRAKVDEMLDSLGAQIGRNSDRIAICRTAADAERIIASGRIAAFLAIENGVAIANDLDLLQHFYDRGVRYLTLTHTASNDWCISSADTLPAFHGLTGFGRQVVRRMNDLGMIVDVSHAAPSAVSAILEISRDPVIASHSCVHALCPHDRNLTDEQIRAIAAGGGMIGINFYRGYLSAEWTMVADSLWMSRKAEVDSLRELYRDDGDRQWEALRPIRQEVRRQAAAEVTVDVRTVVDHIDHIVALVGPDHVGFGSDFDGVGSLPEGLQDCSMVPNITRELLRRGYSHTDARKILGGNFLRIFRQVCDR